VNDKLLEQLAIDLIPQPREIVSGEGTFRPGEKLAIVLPGTADEEDCFAASDLADALRGEIGIQVEVAGQSVEGECAVLLNRRQGSDLKSEGYTLAVQPNQVVIEGNDAAGLFWGTRTLLQSFRASSAGPEIPCMEIEDSPDIRWRSIHYDTKHHQGSFEYVQGFIRNLARYKVNMLVWEWEDKLAYERHPEVGAPGAFTKEQMRELTAFARQYHVQIVPLVQGLGHVSFILKHPQHRHLREIPDSSWEFCPLKEESYELLFDLWDEAMEATPGSEFLHIGSDETYELGLGEACGCKQKADEIGKSGLMQLFLQRSGEHVESRGRRALCWANAPRVKGDFPANMVFMDNSRVEELAAARNAGYDVFSYAPNPGIEPLCLGYFPWVQFSMWRDDIGRIHKGSFRDAADTIADAGKAGITLGSITTSWDDSGLHTQAWMPRFVCAAEYSWSANGPDVDRWIDRFMRRYFGRQASDLRELFQLLQEGALFYYDTFQRRVWHWGEIGKIHLPDFPREIVEYNPFWRRQYAQLLHVAQEERQKVARVLTIIDANLEREVENRYDLEIFRTCAELMRHNVDLVLMLGRLEEAICNAHNLHFSDRPEGLKSLQRARAMIEENLEDRQKVFDDLVEVWDRTRLPKGLSLPEKPFLFSPDRARHFANRTPDMRYLIVDEELLGLEDYLERLKAYIADYEGNLLS
jgi:hexosaminidase